MQLDICRWRLAGQFLTTPKACTGAEIVAALGAVQAQDFRGAKWAVSQRTRSVTDASLERELDAGAILRTHILRPTWHFVAATDIRWMLELTAPRVTATMAPANRRLGLDRPVFRKSAAILEKALAGGAGLTRAELARQLEQGRIAVGTGQRLGHLMMQAELDGVLCSGPRRGKQFTYALLDERAPAPASMARDEALRELTHRYFATRGPATPRDFAWWSGLTVADARRGIALDDDRLERVSSGEIDYWVVADAPRPPRAAGTAFLLPNYDEYFIGFRDRSAIATRLRDLGTVTGANALLPHVIIVDGQLAGVWKRTLEKESVTVMLEPLCRLRRSESARLVTAARRFGRFLGLPVDTRFAA